MVKPLTVYKASAGSGKTFTLATEYIKLLVLNPMSYRNILAVTFTNKATEEMKMRILSQLYGIWKQLPDSDNYARHISAETGLDGTTISKQAGKALNLLLHNYSYFRVETIDTFFQSVLRNLARELDLTANLRIGLNDVQVEEQAVDQLIDSLTHTDVMLQWLLKYIMESISEDRSWNIIGQVKQFGRTIFRDYYKEKSIELNQLISQKNFLDGYMGQMRQIRSDAEKHMKEIAEQFFESLETEGITVDELSYGKTGVYGFFVKLVFFVLYKFFGIASVTLPSVQIYTAVHILVYLVIVYKFLFNLVPSVNPEINQVVNAGVRTIVIFGNKAHRTRIFLYKSATALFKASWIILSIICGFFVNCELCVL